MKIFLAFATLLTVVLAQPINDECITATVVKTFPFRETVNTRLATNNPNDPITAEECSYASENYNDGRTVWYNVQPPSGGLLVITASGKRDTLADYGSFDLSIVGGVFTGSCGSLTEIACDQYLDDTSYLIVEAGKSYFLKFGEVDSVSAGGDMNLTMSFEPNFFEVFDTNSDTSLGPLRDLFAGPFIDRKNTIDYSSELITSSQLTLEAKFNGNATIRSVRFTLDKPPISRCEPGAPFTLYDNSGSNYFGAPFQIGKRFISAVAFSRTSCSGTPSTTFSQSFDVLGCKFLHYAMYDAGRDKYLSTLNNATTIARPPCQVSIGVSFQCGFTASTVRMELRNAATYSLVRSMNENNAPYFLFGDSGTGDIYSGTIPAGEYTITAIIDGIVHPSVRFTFGVCSATAPGIDNRFNIDLRLGFSNLSSVSNARLFPAVVNRVASLVIGDRPDVLNTTSLGRDRFCGVYPPIIDDLYVCAKSVNYYDGPGGVLGFLLFRYARESDGLPFTGSILYDEGDLGNLATSGALSSFFLQQLIQTLGLGLFWNPKGLADRDPPCRYNGTKANLEFKAITNCSSVPLEQNYNADIATSYFNCLFWDQQCLRDEVLTLAVGTKRVSRITLGALEDLGYVVNYTAADPYGPSNIGTCSTCGRVRRAKTATSSCHSGEVYDSAVYHGRKILNEAHEHHQGNVDSLPEGVKYIGNQHISVAYIHEDGTMCSALVTP